MNNRLEIGHVDRDNSHGQFGEDYIDDEPQRLYKISKHLVVKMFD